MSAKNAFIFLTLSLPFLLVGMEHRTRAKKAKIPEHDLVFTQCDGGCPKELWDEKTFPGVLCNDPCNKQIFVHTKDGLHVGLINFSVASRYEPFASYHCFIDRLEVHPQFRRQGIGTQLLHRVIEIMAQQHRCSVITWATTYAAEPFYKKLGADTQNTRNVKYDRRNKGPLIKTPRTKIQQLHKAKHYFPE